MHSSFTVLFVPPSPRAHAVAILAPSSFPEAMTNCEEEDDDDDDDVVIGAGGSHTTPRTASDAIVDGDV